MRRGIAAGVVALATVVFHCSLVFAQAAHGPLPGPSRGTPAVNPPPSTQGRFESTLKFDPRQRDDGRRALPGPGRRFGAPFVFVTPFWLSDGMIRSVDIGDARLRLPLLSGLPPGGVQLDVQPWRAQVYVDGAYAGLVEDFKGYYRHLEISAGPHVIVIVTPDYEPLVVELLVSPGQVTTYRGALNFAVHH